MKTPEQLAADYATSQFPGEGPERAVWRMCRDDFLAAYEAAKPKWISVKDRLPKQGDEVLVFGQCLNDIPKVLGGKMSLPRRSGVETYMGK